MWRKISLVALIVVLAIGIILGGSLAVMRMTPPDAKSIGIRNGDIILQTILGTQGMAIIAASSSPYTHMGFIKTGGKEPVVVEAVGPVKETPLTQWISRGVGQRITILRLKGITPEIAQKAAATAKKHYGKPYDFYFLPDKKSFYCSELVREAYAGAGVTLGKLQKVGELTRIIRDGHNHRTTLEILPALSGHNRHHDGKMPQDHHGTGTGHPRLHRPRPATGACFQQLSAG